MRILRFISVIVLIVSVNLSLFAQEKKVEFGLAGGYGYTLAKLKNSQFNDNLAGFHLGPTFRFNIDERFSVRTSLFYNYFSGINITNSMLKLKKATGVWHQTKINANSIDLPLRLAMQAPLAEDLHFFVMAGPNFNYGLSKVASTEYFTDRKLRRTEKGKNIYETQEYEKIDVQLGLALGLQWRGLFLQGSYDWGVRDRNLKEDVTLRNNDLKVTLGYYF